MLRAHHNQSISEFSKTQSDKGEKMAQFFQVYNKRSTICFSIVTTIHFNRPRKEAI